MATPLETPLLPGATIGILGGGQLGRMMVLAGRRMGYRFAVYEPGASGSSAGMVADRTWDAAYDDTAALADFARSVDRITLEFENIPTATVEALSAHTPVAPGASVLSVCQHRRREKAFLQAHGFPCAPFRVVRSAEALQQAVSELGTPCVVKTAESGYDGKGQVKLQGGEDLAAVWATLDCPEAVVEAWITFTGEFSVICARSAAGERATFPVAENIHQNHILHTTIAPARISPARVKEATHLALAIAEALDVVGLITVELFLTSGGWLVNELAPRPHNSGHYTFDSCVTPQFEQHLRAVCGLPLGDPTLLCPTVMVNLLGERWARGEPDWAGLLRRDPRLKLHLYDKGEPRPGRKMGHFCALAPDLEAALSAAHEADHFLGSV